MSTTMSDPNAEMDSGKKKRKRKRTRKNKKKMEEEHGSGDTIESNEHNINITSTTIYVEGISYDASEEDLESHFQSVCNNIKEIRMPRWQDSGKPRGYAHIDFNTVEETQAALKLNGSDLLGRYLKIAVANDRRKINTVGPRPKGCKTIFVKNLPYDVTEEDVKKVFRIFGVVNYVRLPRWNHTGRLKGIGYVEFKREDSAEIAVKKRSDIHVGGRPVMIDYDDGDGPKQSFKTKDGRKWNKVNKKGSKHKLTILCYILQPRVLQVVRLLCTPCTQH